VSATLPFPDALIMDPLYPRLKEHLVESTGMAYYTDKDVDLARRVGRRLSTLGAPDCACYLAILRDPLRGPSELDALIAEVTIGETYFFRHREHFDALRDLVLPDLIARNRPSRRLRIWSAGCADGPEPYSLSILLKRDLVHELAGWDVTILGTDINRHCLARAREAKFETWALRSTPEELKRACFQSEGRLWRLAPEYKQSVSFQYHNLVQHSFPSLLNNLLGFDLIVCRNVMIYFGPDLMQRMIRQFHDCLVPDGWLLVGPSEPNMTYFSSFRTVTAPGVTLYQKLVAQVVNLRHFLNRPPWDEPDAVSEPIDNQPQDTILPHKPTLADVRRHADGGAWDEAARCCEQLLQKDNLRSATHFHHALVLQQMGRRDEAERSLRRAIYLDRQSVLAHYYLGILLQSRGERSLENALEILRSRSDAEVFADADGISVAELRKLATMHLEILRERV
jgi:chemotaxis protein methyltransferase CheR